MKLNHTSTEEKVASLIEEAKSKAAVAYAAGSSKGLTVLALGFYEVLQKQSKRSNR